MGPPAIWKITYVCTFIKGSYNDVAIVAAMWIKLILHQFEDITLYIYVHTYRLTSKWELYVLCFIIM